MRLLNIIASRVTFGCICLALFSTVYLSDLPYLDSRAPSLFMGSALMLGALGTFALRWIIAATGKGNK